MKAGTDRFDHGSITGSDSPERPWWTSRGQYSVFPLGLGLIACSHSIIDSDYTRLFWCVSRSFVRSLY